MENSKKSLHKPQWSFSWLKEIPRWNTVDFSCTHWYVIKTSVFGFEGSFFYSAKYDPCHFVVSDIPNLSFITDLFWIPRSCSVPPTVPAHGSKSLKHIFFPLREMPFFPSTSVFPGSETFPAGTLEGWSERQLARRYFKQIEVTI